MKRPLETREASDRPRKKVGDEVHFNEIKTLHNSAQLTENAYISGEVLMHWPVSHGIFKIQLRKDGQVLDITLPGRVVEAMANSIQSKAKLRISLRGVTVKEKKHGSSTGMEFTLVWEEGVVLSCLPSHSDNGPQTINLFNVPNEADNWFLTPLDSAMAPTVQPLARNSSPPAKPSPPPPPLNQAAAASTKDPQRKQPKEKRVKKRDTRHSAEEDNVKSKAKKQKVAEARRKAKQAAVRKPPPLPLAPVQDPALDHQAGFTTPTGDSYLPLKALRVGVNGSIIGIVTDVSPTKTTRTGDCSKSYIIVDPSNYPEGIKVVAFTSGSNSHLLPSTKEGQVLLLRGVYVQNWQDKPQGVCRNRLYKWCGFDPVKGKHFYSTTDKRTSDSAGSPEKPDIFFKVGSAELDYFVKISDWWRAKKELEQKARGVGEATNLSRSFRIRDATVAELKEGVFSDCTVEVLHLEADANGVTVYVTDYSEHPLLEYMEPSDIFPQGRRTFRITLWDAAKDMADQLKSGGYYLFENIKVKRVFDRIEGNVGRPYEPNISKIGAESPSERLEEVKRRKEQYQRHPSASVLPAEEDGVSEPLYQGHNAVEEDVIVQPAPKLPKVVNESPEIVKCLHNQQQCSTVQEVLDSELCPNKFKIRCQIVDYYPLQIQDFVRAECKQCGKVLGEEHDLCPDCADMTDGSISITYNFVLRVADESGAEINVSVHGKEGDKFIPQFTAAEARDNVDILKTRLRPLIGHLSAWRESFDEVNKGEGPWIELSIYSWEAEGGGERLHSVFDCSI